MSFNPFDPIILVGDNNGGVNLLKLSESLSMGPMQPDQVESKGDKKEDKKKAKEPPKTSLQLEQEKMDAFLSTQDKVDY